MANRKAGNAARMAKLISFARRIWFSSSMALSNNSQMHFVYSVQEIDFKKPLMNVDYFFKK